jgi:hypothetical protein
MFRFPRYSEVKDFLTADIWQPSSRYNKRQSWHRMTWHKLYWDDGCQILDVGAFSLLCAYESTSLNTRRVPCFQILNFFSNASSFSCTSSAYRVSHIILYDDVTRTVLIMFMNEFLGLLTRPPETLMLRFSSEFPFHENGFNLHMQYLRGRKINLARCHIWEISFSSLILLK